MMFGAYYQHRYAMELQAAAEIGVNEPYWTFLYNKYVVAIGLDHNNPTPDQFKDFEYIYRRARELDHA